MLKAMFFQFSQDIVKHLRFDIFPWKMEPASFLSVHKYRMILQNQTIKTEMGNIKGQGLGYIVHHLVHGLTRQGINQIDGDIMKTSGLEAVNGFINLAFIVAATDAFQHLVVKGLNAQRNPIAG